MSYLFEHEISIEDAELQRLRLSGLTNQHLSRRAVSAMATALIKSGRVKATQWTSLEPPRTTFKLALVILGEVETADILRLRKEARDAAYQAAAKILNETADRLDDALASGGGMLRGQADRILALKTEEMPA